jgi:hypothetical protein
MLNTYILSPTETSLNESRGNRAKKQRRAATSGDGWEAMIKACQALGSDTQPSNPNPDILFGQFVGAQLMTMSAARKKKWMAEIMRSFLENLDPIETVAHVSPQTHHTQVSSLGEQFQAPSLSSRTWAVPSVSRQASAGVIQNETKSTATSEKSDSSNRESRHFPRPQISFGSSGKINPNIKGYENCHKYCFNFFTTGTKQLSMLVVNNLWNQTLNFVT